MIRPFVWMAFSLRQILKAGLPSPAGIDSLFLDGQAKRQVREYIEYLADDSNKFRFVIGGLLRYYVGELLLKQLRAVRAAEAKRRSSANKPSLAATFLLYLFLDGKAADSLVGDIEERFPRMIKKYGRGRAQRWVWSQTIRSLGPIIWAWGKKAAGLTALYDIWKRMMS